MSGGIRALNRRWLGVMDVAPLKKHNMRIEQIAKAAIRKSSNSSWLRVSLVPQQQRDSDDVTPG